MKNPDEKVNMGAFHDAKKQAFERERKGSFGKGSFRRERNARGARGRREGNACQETIVFLFFNIYVACSRLSRMVVKVKSRSKIRKRAGAGVHIFRVSP